MYQADNKIRDTKPEPLVPNPTPDTLNPKVQPLGLNAKA